MTGVWAPAGSAAFNARLGESLAALAADLERHFGSQLQALILGGGYGRGEGAVQTVAGDERPYNDLDLFAITSGGTLDGVDEVCRPHAAALGIHVDVGRSLRLHEIRHWSPSLMWFDLVHGHRVLVGDATILRENVPGAVRRDLPAREATRLLLNRGMGLLWAFRVAHGVDAEPDADFVRRNAFKAMLAFGDATLIAHGRYASAVARRGSRFIHLSRACAEVANLRLETTYARALRFKTEPDRYQGRPDVTALVNIADTWEKVLLHVDGLRAGRSWQDVDEFCASPGRFEDGSASTTDAARNVLRNLALGRLSGAHPRERLYRELPRLLAAAASPTADWAARSAQALDAWHRFQ
jgi:hypothetical protein